jgi:myo-inositol-1(or 4)-monophosphatase
MNRDNNINLLNIAVSAATAGTKLAKQYLNDAGVLSNSGKDVKTIADVEVNNIILNHLISTGIPILSEESENFGTSIPSLCWIVDPLDGTYNFTRDFPFACVSIALWSDKGPQIGIVQNIFNSDIFIASLNANTTFNGNNISVSSIDDLSCSLLSTGFPSGSSYDTADLLKVVRNVQVFKKVRTIGSASMMLSYVSKGVFDVYYENGIYLWDVAAGLCLVKQAGGEYILKPTAEPYKYEVLASNKALFNDAIKTLMIS